MTRNHHAARLAIAPFLLAAASLHAQVEPAAQQRARESSGIQQQREQLRQQEDERQQRLEAPDGRLQNRPDETSTQPSTDPAEKDVPCFEIRELHIGLPEQLSTTQRRLGASDLFMDDFHFLRQAADLHLGTCIGRKGIALLQQQLSNLILSRGYSTTRLGIPEQDLSSGKLSLVLIPGVIRSVVTLPVDPGRTWKTALPSRPGDLLNIRDIEQGLEQLKRVPGQDAEIRILPGEQPGESDIVIEIKRHKSWRFSVTADDSGSKGTGQLQAGMNAAIDNPLGLNDLFHIGFNTDANRKGRQRGTTGNAAGYSIPFGYWTFSLAAGSYQYHQEIAGRFQTFMSSGIGKNVEFKVQHLFHRDQFQKSSLQFKIGKRWNRAYIDNTEIEVQRRNATYAELGWLHRHYFGTAQLDLMLANRWGVNWFNGEADAPARPPGGPTRRYSLQTLDATLLAPFPIGGLALTYIGTLRAQSTQSGLYASEQFSIGNRYTVRGFDGELSLSAERGFFLRNEIDLPLGNSRQSVYAGVDVGKVYGPTVQYLLGDKLAGAAVGMRGAVFNMNYDAFLGWALYKPQHFRGSPTVAGFQLTYQF